MLSYFKITLLLNNSDYFIVFVLSLSKSIHFKSMKKAKSLQKEILGRGLANTLVFSRYWHAGSLNNVVLFKFQFRFFPLVHEDKTTPYEERICWIQ